MILMFAVLLPIVFGLLMLVMPPRGILREILTVMVALINLGWALSMQSAEISFSFPWAGSVIAAFKLYHFNHFIWVAASGFGVALALYSAVFMHGKPKLNQFYAYFLLTLGQVNGALFADHLIVMLFFWESLMLTLFGLIYVGGPKAYKTAIKAFIIAAIADFCMMVGVGLTGKIAGTFVMSQISLPLGGVADLAMIMLLIGAIAKAGSMPFHSWIPDAAVDAPLPFMALIPAALEKLLGIYFLARITLDLYKFSPESGISTLLMVVGSLTILLAVMMALIQKDYKKLLSYHAISQVGYMVLGIGTAVPVGIIGGIFHMLNHAIYKSCLFLTAGSVEKQTGTTDLKALGGLRQQMPVTFFCFAIAAASISGIPPFNGFFSKELVYDGALERSVWFYAAALLGSFLTAASFLKLGHAAYYGKATAKSEKVKESSILMLIPMITMAAFCIGLGLFNQWPIEQIVEPILGTGRLAGHHFSGWPHSTFLVIMTVIVVIAATLHHFWGVKRHGSGVAAADHIHHAPGLSQIYDCAESGKLDPYDITVKGVGLFSQLSYILDRLWDRFYEVVCVGLVELFSALVRSLQTGIISHYVLWCLAGMVFVIVYVMQSI